MRLELVGLYVRYGQRPVLTGVELAVGPGELVALCGPNGAGKTTLLRCAAGVLKPQAGSVRVDGRDVSSLSARERARLVGYLPQDPSVPAGLRCVEVAQLGRYACATGWGLGWSPGDREAAEQALRATETAHLRDRPVQHTSGGERQRVLLARVLAQGARLLVLDEPTAHLDFGHQVSVAVLLRRLSRDGYGILVATHDLNLASLFFDRVVLLAGGRVVAHGPPREVLRTDVVERAYGPTAVVCAHPQTGSPVVVPRVSV
ncbi:MAG: ABC transporter ATP-binding protein [bacterium]